MDGKAQAEDCAGTAAGAGKEGCVGLGASQLAARTGVTAGDGQTKAGAPLSVDRESSSLINRSKMQASASVQLPPSTGNSYRLLPVTAIRLLW